MSGSEPDEDWIGAGPADVSGDEDWLAGAPVVEAGDDDQHRLLQALSDEDEDVLHAPAPTANEKWCTCSCP